MVYTAHIKNGVVVFDNGSPPEGAKLRIEVIERHLDNNKAGEAKPGGVWAVLQRYAGSVKGLPCDMARNHDHYIHGSPKKP